MEILADYLVFLLKVFTIALAITVPLLLIIGSSKGKTQAKGKLAITNLSEKFEDMGNAVRSSNMNPKELKKFYKDINKSKKKKTDENEPSIFVLNFNGDIQASEVEKLKYEINAILLSESECKEVVVKVESGGGSAYAYGLCAAELKRLVDNDISLTVCIDKVAASGGYLMSCVATKIIAAPWAIVGSIGVIAQLPNFHRLLKKNLIDFELHTAGEFKRTLTTLGENTEDGRDKFKADLEDLHVIFKDFVKEQRPEVDTAVVATGEVWQGEEAVRVGLVDSLETSDNYLVNLSKDATLFEIEYIEKKNLSERFAFSMQLILEKSVVKFYDLINRDRYTS
ncbi:protease SohB [Gammaproteobacteria bacterium]|mgnify:FL=1|nr:protease SohB [Gammaproteobacteria bacterium]MDC0577191.1 protease SohB [Gammaproteobacteria bacterium]MDC0590870.1 protease SohB [Gammaproteobacteria bacterium]